MSDDSIEAWLTGPDGINGPDGGPPVWLDRSKASPFRRFAVSAELNGTGSGSLEYHLDNAIVASFDDLFAYGNLVWFKYRGKTRTWVVEQRSAALDESEHATDWVKVSGRGVRQLIGDRTIWPTHYDDAHADPSVWSLGGWSTKTDAVAALAQRVIPVVSTTAGLGATVGDPLEIVGGGNRQVGIIASIVAGVSVTLVDPLAYTFPTGSRVRAAASQWRRFVNRAAGEMCWDIIAESNPRFATQIVRGIVQTTGADGWTQDFRFDNALDVLAAVENMYGDVEMDGLTFNYRNAMGVDRTATVILEEGADVIRLAVDDNDRDSISWVVAEGTGHAVFSFLAPKKKLTRAQRKTAARRAALHHRKAPAAPRKVVLVKADYTVDLASEAVAIARRREAFLDAKDISDPAQLAALAEAALDEHQVAEAVGLELVETRYAVDVDYGLGDWIRAIVPSRGFDEDVRVVAVAFTEDDTERIRVSIDVNTPREDHLLRLAQGAKDTRSSLGVQNRQPQGQLVPHSFSAGGFFDSGSVMNAFVKIPDRVTRLIEVMVTLSFREFQATATAASSGGGATSGASSSATTNSDSHKHFAAQWTSNTPIGGASRAYVAGDGGVQLNLTTGSAGDIGTTAEVTTGGVVTGGHSHGNPHTHSTPNHVHGLTYGTFEEAFPASHSVTLRVYERTDTTWTLRGTFAGLTGDLVDLDLSAVMTGPGDWRLTLISAGGQPNGGRLGCDVFGVATGAIQSA